MGEGSEAREGERGIVGRGEEGEEACAVWRRAPAKGFFFKFSIIVGISALMPQSEHDVWVSLGILENRAACH